MNNYDTSEVWPLRTNYVLRFLTEGKSELIDFLNIHIDAIAKMDFLNKSEDEPGVRSTILSFYFKNIHTPLHPKFHKFLL
jgi:hypothetical protein